MKHSPFFKFDAMQWLGGSIQYCTLEEKGLFIDLCAHYWESQKPVQIDRKFKVRYRYPEGTLEKILGTLTSLEIIVYSEAGVTIPFLDRLMDERAKWLKKCSEGGKKSVSSKGTSSNKKEERRKKKEESRKKNTPPDTPEDLFHLENIEKPKSNGKYPEDFEDFWKAYERKGSKANAFKAWKKLSLTDKHDALAAIDSYFLENPEPRYRKDCERYLKHRVFESVMERQRSVEDIPMVSNRQQHPQPNTPPPPTWRQVQGLE